VANDTKRAYDSRRRRERAEDERRETRRRVIDAAHRLFVANGYVGTTMAQIAKEAGVAIQSVYKAGTSKADLLHVVVDVAVAGDDEELLMEQRQIVADIAKEPDPREQVRRIAALVTLVQDRSAPIQAAYRQAAATDDKVAAELRAAHLRRLETFAGIVGMIPSVALRYSPEATTDTVWAIGSSEVYLLFRDVRGWSSDQFREWLTTTLLDQILVP